MLIISGENWHHGVIGIVSARILEKYGKPNMIISFNGVEGRASARSIDGFSLYKLYILFRFVEKPEGTQKPLDFNHALGNANREFMSIVPIIQYASTILMQI